VRVCHSPVLLRGVVYGRQCAALGFGHCRVVLLSMSSIELLEEAFYELKEDAATDYEADLETRGPA
jgi:hypothetical protein